MQGVFKELIDASKMRSLPEERKALLCEMHKFIMSGDWGFSKDHIYRVLTILRIGEENAADSLDMKISEVNAEISKASKIISDIFGANAIRTILSSSDKDFVKVRRNFELAVKPVKPNNYLVNDLLLFVKSAAKQHYNLNKLNQEVELLKKYTRSELLAEIKKVNPDKLAFTIGVLASNTVALTPLRVEILKQILEKVSL